MYFNYPKTKTSPRSLLFFLIHFLCQFDEPSREDNQDLYYSDEIRGNTHTYLTYNRYQSHQLFTVQTSIKQSGYPSSSSVYDVDL